MTANAWLTGGADFLADGATVVGAFILELGRGEHVIAVDDEQQVIVCLRMDISGVRCSRDVIHGRATRFCHSTCNSAFRNRTSTAAFLNRILGMSESSCGKARRQHSTSDIWDGKGGYSAMAEASHERRAVTSARRC